jgi:PAS domain S-box-containing protein
MGKSDDSSLNTTDKNCPPIEADVADPSRPLSDYALLRASTEMARLGGWMLLLSDQKVYCSDSMGLILGDVPGSTLSRDQFTARFIPEYREKMHSVLENCAAEKVPFEEEMQLEKHPGEVVWIRVAGNALEDAAGRMVGVRGYCEDITRQRQAIIQLAESEKRLLELNATKDKFFSIIAHDLRSPFYTIQGFCSILSEQVKAKDYEGVDEYADIILKSSQKAMDLLKNLLEWAISQTGRMVYNPESMDVYQLVHETIDLIRDSAVQKSISIGLDAPNDLHITADKAMMSSILRNLLSNAIKFSKLEGSIHVSVKKADQELVFAVKDHGVGMTESQRKKLFRIDEAHATKGTRKEEGTGLGLILCKEFVSRHGGRIWVETVPDAGSTFYFTIPEVTA